jgi:hypothetical protein
MLSSAVDSFNSIFNYVGADSPMLSIRIPDTPAQDDSFELL